MGTIEKYREFLEDIRGVMIDEEISRESLANMRRNYTQLLKCGNEGSGLTVAEIGEDYSLMECLSDLIEVVERGLSTLVYNRE